jgi:hypothetical protein
MFARLTAALDLGLGEVRRPSAPITLVQLHSNSFGRVVGNSQILALGRLYSLPADFSRMSAETASLMIVSSPYLARKRPTSTPSPDFATRSDSQEICARPSS